ncbi:TonB-dependent receptor [Dyella sp. BiH032]|uniref:TonB-dependent receptor plug domain-containing protein n=1 Tax=Dyella sp. BiH032 TaxID=3075430 RepID=UPI002892A861|nr:TonB-dependent receptor [Dyella sp. BiH032]WNL47104.1 TonB-dependent receptor [Dyella sp. BiH032]
MTKRLKRRLPAAALLPLCCMHALAATTAWADDKPADPASPEKAKQLQQVVVTGTRSTDRTASESLAPIDVLTPADLNATGSTDLASALSTLLPSLDFPRPAINDGNDAIRPASLRGMSPDQVLVLVDGKRYHTTSLVNYNSAIGRGSAPVDLNSIPIAAIDHIEVLRDGAAAQYGSDAIAGVINVVLKRGSVEGGNSITANGGIMDKGDGAQNGVQGTMGVALGGPNGSAPGWMRVAWNYQNVMNTNRAENRDKATTIAGAPNPSGIPYERYGDPAVKTYQVLLNFGYNITPGVELYGYLNGSKRDVTSNGYYRAYNSARNVPQIYPNGFLPQIVNHSNDIAAVLGVRGTTEGGWHWDFSADHGENNLAFDIANSVNTNLYHTNGYSPTYFNAGTFRNKQSVANLDLSKDVHVGFLPNAVTVAFGAEYRKETYVIDAGDPDSYFFDPTTLIPGTTTPYAGGSQVFPGLTPQVAGSFGRHSEAAYVDLETDVTNKLSAGLAGRYEHYSDAGSTRSGKLSARYQFTDTFALRGTVSNGFRAPSLAQQNYESVVTLIQNGQLAQIGTYRTSDPVAIALGAKPLKPEKSTNYGLGAVWQPWDAFSATLDLYQIRVGNAILYSDQIAVSIPNSQVTGAQFFVNGATTRTRGADLIANYRMDLDGWGKLNLTASGNYNKTKVLSISTPAFGRASEGLLTSSTPRTKYVFSGDWQLQGFGLHANLTRYGSVIRRGDADDGSQDQKFAARWLLDLAASYAWREWTFTAGVDNLTNQYPTKASLANVYEDRADGLQYSSLSPFGFNGRYWYGKVTYRF